MAGYSGTPLAQKLGLKPAARLGTYGAPKNLSAILGPLPSGISIADGARGSSPFDVILCFADSRAALARWFPRAHARLDPSGGFWVCWPKKASGVATDLTEADVRALGLRAGLVDNKVCAIDEVWSGLRLVVRLAHRPKAAAPAASTSKKRTKRKGQRPKKP